MTAEKAGAKHGRNPAGAVAVKLGVGVGVDAGLG